MTFIDTCFLIDDKLHSKMLVYTSEVRLIMNRTSIIRTALCIGILSAMNHIAHPALATEDNSIGSELKPTSSMPMWFYKVKEQFKYPIPCDFEFAYIDKKGTLRVTGPFHHADPFKDGFAKVTLGCYKLDNGVWKVDPSTSIVRVLLDKDGKVVRKVKEKSNFFSPKVKLLRGKRVLVLSDLISRQSKRKKASKHKLEGTKPLELKAYKDQITGKWGYEDEEGNEFIEPKFDYAHPFKNGFARVEDRSGETTTAPLMRQMTKMSKLARSDDKETAKVAKEKLSELSKQYRKSIHHESLVGYINLKGKFVIPFGKYLEGKDFSDDLAAVFYDDSWGYIDSSGTEVIKSKYKRAGNFGNGLAPVLSNGKYGFIDEDGKLVIESKFVLTGNFVDGLAPATLDGRHWGYIDTTGRFAVQPTFKRAFDFSNGRALVMIPPRTSIDENRSEALYFYLSHLYYSRIDKRTSSKALDVASSLGFVKESRDVSHIY